jgi:hypothetical protein
MSLSSAKLEAGGATYVASYYERYFHVKEESTSRKVVNVPPSKMDEFQMQPGEKRVPCALC